jgi:hypothetical protein
MAYIDDSIEFGGAPIARTTELYQVNGAECLVDAIRFDRQAVTDEQMVEACGHNLANRKASQFAEFAKGQIRNADHAVYVAALKSGRACKIGVTNNPLQRLLGLQNGCHERISLTHLFWMPRAAAIGIEGLALRTATRLGKRLLGEWVEMSADQAALVVAVVINSSTVAASCSQMYRRNCQAALMAGGINDDEDTYSHDPFWNLVKAGY